ncbi:MAG TPA: hypothetical protein DDY13_14450 [Cytophagales bacterium]|jgi:hypothetical protein|nr:hypothetical protein [Cytophagales bacterium]
MQYQPAIVVITYNRLSSLKRLLSSIDGSRFEDYPDLIISIDYSDTYQDQLAACAESFAWKGEKHIIRHKSNLGLRSHVFFCGRLSTEYGSVIVLEDDLYVAPDFYLYSLKALEILQTSQTVSGIGLYSPSFNEAAALPFEPVKTNSNLYLMQVPCSWGQIWTKDQWSSFENWLNDDFDIEQLNLLPAAIQHWSDQSWKKLYMLYLSQKNYFFAYPYTSYSMNLNEPGTHIIEKDYKFLNGLPLNNSVDKLKLDKQAACYDMHYMLIPDVLNETNSADGEYDYEIDLYGTKLDQFDEEQWLITALKVTSFEKSFGLQLKPIELNILFGIEGTEIFLTQKKYISSRELPRTIIDFNYPIPKWYYPYFQTPILKRLNGFIHFKLKRLFKD